MSRITKQIAEDVAVKLTKKQALEIEKLQKDMKQKFTEIYLKTIPKEIMDLFEKYPKYFEKRSSFQISGNGFQYQQLHTDKDYPSSQYSYSLKEKDASLMLGLMNTLDDKKNELYKLKKEVANLLFNLRTYAKVNSEFPEASPFLPKTVTTALMVNISDLREKLK